MGNALTDRSQGPTVDALELKVSGVTGLESDLRRTQEVELIVRGTVVGHTIEDKRDQNGDVKATIKTAKVKVDELRSVQVLRAGSRDQADGQTAIEVDGSLVDAATGEVLEAPVLTDEMAAQIETEMRADGHDVSVTIAHDDDDASDFPASSEEPESEPEPGDLGPALGPADGGSFPPSPVSPDGPPMTNAQLTARRDYLAQAGAGLPPEAGEARAAEIAEINRRLSAQSDAA